MSLRLLRKSLRARRCHLSPFLVLGDPTSEVSARLAIELVRAGASMIELGLPYGDACADGPAIQAAGRRALDAGTTTDRAFEIMKRMREACPEIPFNLLVYGNLVHARGFARFAGDAAASGASSLLVPDIPLEESAPLRAACRAARLGHVQMVGPLTPPDRLRRLDAASDAFLYLAAHQGVTGAASGAADPGEAAAALVRRVAAGARRPLCLGFGIRTPEQVRSAFDAGATIAVVGSHLARAVATAWDPAASGREDRTVATVLSTFKPLLEAVPSGALPCS